MKNKALYKFLGAVFKVFRHELIGRIEYRLLN
jgi:hypothetical protein